MQRVEIITGTERRRRWSDDDKRLLVAEAFAPGAVASRVARRHNVAESCLFSWRKRFGAPPNGSPSGAPRLIPVIVEPESPLASAVPQPDMAPVRLRTHHAVITWPNGVRLDVPAGYPAAALKALIGALRQTR